MTRFLIEVPHSPDKRACLQVVQIFLKTGSHYLDKFSLQQVELALAEHTK